MFLSLVLALQAAAPAPAPQRWAMPVLTAGAPLDFDLARYRPAGGPCFGASAEEVVVCGRRGGAGDYPIAQWARIFAARPIRAERDLGGNIQGRIHAEAVPMDRGAVSNRVMIGIGTRF
jgi:hypothetical protein